MRAPFDLLIRRGALARTPQVFRDRYANAIIGPKISRGVNNATHLCHRDRDRCTAVNSLRVNIYGWRIITTPLTPVYDLVPPGNYRFLVFSVTVILAGNYLFQRLYSW